MKISVKININDSQTLIQIFEDYYLKFRKCMQFILFFFCLYIIFESYYLKPKENIDYEYFFCFAAMGKGENIYAKEVIEYYKKLGVKKFIIADNNMNNSEKFQDILQKEIDDKIVDIIDKIGQKQDQTALYGEIYEKYKTKCNWISFFDFDEFLVIKNQSKNATIQTYLSNPKFDKCNVVLINWLIFSDNELITYDNRTLNERFKKYLINHEDNRFVKSIIRGNIKFNPWSYGQTPHRPEYHLKTCNSGGDRAKTFNDVIKNPDFENGYIKHFVTKSAEEYILKVKRGHPGNVILYFDKRVDIYFIYNKVTKEKIKFFEKTLNRTFPKYHYVYNNSGVI